MPLTHGARTSCRALPAGTKDHGQDGSHGKVSRLPVLEARGPNPGCQQGRILLRSVRENPRQGPVPASGGALPATFGRPWPVDASPRSLPPCSPGGLLCVSMSRLPLFIHGCLPQQNGGQPTPVGPHFHLTNYVCRTTVAFKIVLPNACRIM